MLPKACRLLERTIKPTLVVIVLSVTSCSLTAKSEETNVFDEQKQASPGPLLTATFGAGCFWCVEAVFEDLDGVDSVESGYTGGQVNNPTYEEVCTGLTGHAEVCQIKYDPSRVKFKELLEVFWKTHDPTTLNRQGADRGTQYRSAVFYHNEEQKEITEAYKKQLDESGDWRDPIVTEISPLTDYFTAEKYHQDYFKNNPFQGYCRAVIRPKVKKFKRQFADKLKKK